MDAFEQKVFGWIRHQGLLNGCGRVLLAVSGGADSMAMLHVLLGLEKAGLIQTAFAVGHVHHQIRGIQADEDQRFAEQMAGRLDLEFFSRKADVPAFAREQKLSLEMAGRILRIRMLSRMAQQWAAQAVATAHHLGDQAETLIFRMLRGTGFRGLCGIRPVGRLEGVRFIRPMLAVSRLEIVGYLRREGLSWREDQSNADCGFARNRIRHHILPVLEKESGADLATGLGDLACQSQRLFERIETGIEKLASVVRHRQPGRIDLDRPALAACSPLAAGEIIRRCLEEIGAGLRDYSSRHYQGLLQTIYAGRLMQQHLPAGVECFADEEVVTFRRKARTEIEQPESSVFLEQEGIFRFGPFEIRSNLLKTSPVCRIRESRSNVRWVEQLDADKIRGRILIRARKAGDRFQPLGMKADKKIGKFLTTARIDPDIKSQVFVIEDAEKILWVAPVRISEMAKVDQKTCRVLRIQIKQIQNV